MGCQLVHFRIHFLVGNDFARARRVSLALLILTEITAGLIGLRLRHDRDQTERHDRDQSENQQNAATRRCCRVKFSTQSDQPCSYLSSLTYVLLWLIRYFTDRFCVYLQHFRLRSFACSLFFNPNWKAKRDSS